MKKSSKKRRKIMNFKYGRKWTENIKRRKKRNSFYQVVIHIFVVHQLACKKVILKFIFQSLKYFTRCVLFIVIGYLQPKAINSHIFGGN